MAWAQGRGMSIEELIPAPLHDRPFTVAEATAAGVERWVLRRKDLHRPRHGVRMLQDPDTVAARARALLAVLPEGAVASHVTAAQLHGLWVPPKMLEVPTLHVTVPQGARVRRLGVVAHHGIETRDVTLVHGIPVTTPAETWADLAGALDPTDLIAAGDGIARTAAGMRQLHEVAARRRARVRLMREVLAQVRSRSASRMESIARIEFVAAGFPEPHLNVDLVDAAGQFVACVDFLWDAARLALEFQSKAHHGTDEQREADETRRLLVESTNRRIIFITPQMLRRGPRRTLLFDNIRAHLVSRGVRVQPPHDDGRTP